MAGSKTSARKASGARRLFLGALLAGCVGLVVVQSAPSIEAAFLAPRAMAEDQVVSTAIADQGVFSRLTGMWRAQKRVEELETEVRELAIWKDAAIGLTYRVQAYEELLNLEGEPLPVGITARIVAETNGPFAETRLANAGARNLVGVGAIALNTDGLVGRVIHVGASSSRILLLTDYNSRVPVLGEISRARGIVAGGEGPLGFIVDSPEADFIAGERLLTSGEGGAFPPGLRVGLAVAGHEDWRVQFAFSQGAPNFVRLLPFDPIPTPEEDPVISESPPETDLAQAPVMVRSGEGQ